MLLPAAPPEIELAIMPPLTSNLSLGVAAPIPTLVPSKIKPADPETILLEFL